MNSYGEQFEAAMVTEIKIILLERGLTQTDLAKAIGAGRVVLNRYLNGHQSMQMPTFLAIAAALEVTPQDLMRRAGDRIAQEAPMEQRLA